MVGSCRSGATCIAEECVILQQVLLSPLQVHALALVPGILGGPLSPGILGLPGRPEAFARPWAAVICRALPGLVLLGWGNPGWPERLPDVQAGLRGQGFVGMPQQLPAASQTSRLPRSSLHGREWTAVVVWAPPIADLQHTIRLVCTMILQT